MSFIRCLSNPEGLYVFGSSRGIEFWTSLNPITDIVCDTQDFYEFVRQWFEFCEDEFSYKNLVYKYEKRLDDFKVYLKVDNNEIEMWYVTWMYIVNNVLDRLVKESHYNQLYPEKE
jgi:hypothetical protein